ncbi:hypothetical protein [Pontiella agarivorans]|uniref:Uncharacterized protein n=1 Tax=Pontiella agarivorans TaxID=3038953 RepID=A0ABU5N157_9BACT|nr:hypothetical protein [Pontiella agarivorans]MDZ8119981.1 hypothetical protein [Pontiella agarivorans]
MKHRKSRTAPPLGGPEKSDLKPAVQPYVWTAMDGAPEKTNDAVELIAEFCDSLRA